MSLPELLRIEPRYDMPSYLWPRPRYRGVLHAVGALLTVPLGFALVVAADGSRARWAASIYIVAQATVFATSAAYHRIARRPEVRRRMQVADHSMIYVLIFGTWVPLCLLVMSEARGLLFLAGIGGAAAVGIVLKLFGVDRFPYLANTMYVIMGWAGLLALPSIVSRMTLPALALLTAGGVTYSLGALVLMLKRPDPKPTEFGYHEIWHACTVLAAGCHFTMTWIVVS